MQFVNDEQFQLMTSKGVYPFEYIDNYNKLHEIQLSEQNKFYSSLNNSHCSIEDYNRAITVWNTTAIQFQIIIIYILWQMFFY